MATREKVLGFIKSVFQKRVHRQLTINVSQCRRGYEEYDLLLPAKLLRTFCKLHKGFIQRGAEAESESDSDYFQKGQDSAFAPLSNSSEPFPVNRTAGGE